MKLFRLDSAGLRGAHLMAKRELRSIMALAEERPPKRQTVLDIQKSGFDLYKREARSLK